MKLGGLEAYPRDDKGIVFIARSNFAVSWATYTISHNSLAVYIHEN